ncbi:unnamed protein product [Bursaphelenchus okinawaensis]|uniref:Uncharacterized protein n=1 Tax=Bursaphelenchus okinawaensis TaxID=465554 RepID=A0A811K9Q5_9BILA|nr:unnamed protein product [Bursaphelenchus okinawaensis]CAG9096248.1 unnamed protein product [Bursaphelenchus okinawaensis]
MSETQVVEQLSVEKLDDSVKKEMTDSGIQENNYNKSLESSLSKPSEKPSPNGDVYHENGHNDNSDHFQNHNADLKAEEHPEEDFEHINLDSEVVKTEEQPFDADKSFEDAVSEISDKLDAKVEEYLDQLDEQEQKVLEVIDNVLNKHKSVDEDKEGRSESGGVKQGEVNNGGADQDKTDSSTDQAENVNVDQGPHEHTSTDGKDSTEDVNQEGVPQDATEPSATEPAERNDLDNRVHVQLTPEALDGVTVEENTNIEDKVNVEQTEESKLKDSVKKEATEAFEKEETHLHNTESESSLPIEENPHDKQNQGEQYKQDESNVEATPEPVDNIEETFEKVETVPLAAEGATELAEKKSNDNIVVHSQEASELAQEQLVDKVPEKEQEKESTNVAPVDSVSLVYEATEAATRLRNASESEIIADTPERVVEENNERLEEETAKQDSEGLFESQEVSQEAEADFESQDSRQKSEALSESPVAQIEGALAGNTNVIDENKEEFKENPEETKQSTESNEEARKVEQEEEKAVEQNQQVDESLPVTENASDGAEANLAANEGAKTPEIFIEQHDEDLTQNEAIEDQKAAEPNNEFVDEPVRVEQLQSSDAVEPNTGLESEVDAKETAEAEGEVVAEGQAEIKVDSSDSQVAPVEANKASSEFNNDAVAAESEAKEEDVAQKASETQDSPVQDNVEETFEKVEAPVLEQQPNLDKSPSTDTLLDEQQPQVVVNSDVAPNAYDNVTKLEVVNGEVEHEEEHKHEKTGVAGKILKVFHNLIDRHLVEQY